MNAPGGRSGRPDAGSGTVPAMRVGKVRTLAKVTTNSTTSSGNTPANAKLMSCFKRRGGWPRSQIVGRAPFASANLLATACQSPRSASEILPLNFNGSYALDVYG